MRLQTPTSGMRDEQRRTHHASRAFVAPVRLIEQGGVYRVNVQRRLELRAPIHRQDVPLCRRCAVLICNYYRSTVLQTGGVVSLEVHFGKCDGVLLQGEKHLGVSQSQPLSDRESVREEGFAPCRYTVNAGGAWRRWALRRGEGPVTEGLNLMQCSSCTPAGDS